MLYQNPLNPSDKYYYKDINFLLKLHKFSFINIISALSDLRNISLYAVLIVFKKTSQCLEKHEALTGFLVDNCQLSIDKVVNCSN